MPPMTPVQTRANGLVIPPLPQLWLTAVLRLLVELVLRVVSKLRMNRRRPAECHSDATPTALPVMKNDTQQETQTSDRRAPARQSTRSVEEAAAHDDPTIIILGSGPPVRVPRESGDPGTASRLEQA
jgi:hypothetical protein